MLVVERLPRPVPVRRAPAVLGEWTTASPLGVATVRAAHHLEDPAVLGDGRHDDEEGVAPMAAMKPRTGDGPLEVTKEGRSIILRMPLEGGGRLVVEMTPDEVRALADALNGAVV